MLQGPFLNFNQGFDNNSHKQTSLLPEEFDDIHKFILANQKGNLNFFLIFS